MTEYDDTPAPTVFIYCDSPSHARPAAVTNYDQIEPEDHDGEDAGHWTERFSSPAAQGGRDSGTTLVGNRLPSPEELYPGSAVAGLRSRYAPRCRKCGQSVTAREERLFAALNTLARHRIARVSLAELAAIVQRIDA